MKIFGLGLSRTGTTSLTHALKVVGYNVIHYPINKKILFDSNNDGASDIPVIAYYKELDKKFPNSKFIYTIRDKEEWLDAMDRYLERKKYRIIGHWGREIRTAVYGQMEFDRGVFATKYDEHDNDVRAYFADRPQDLLVLNICSGDGWEKLNKFLNITNKNVGAFPHENIIK